MKRRHNDDRIDNVNVGVQDRRRFRLFAPLGLALMTYGFYGLWVNSTRTHPATWFGWLGVYLAAHDLVVAPLVIVFGVFASRLLPRLLRAPVQGALIVSGIVIVTVAPLVARAGTTNHPSQLPNDYGIGLVWVLTVVWLSAAGLILARSRRKS